MVIPVYMILELDDEYDLNEVVMFNLTLGQFFANGGTGFEEKVIIYLNIQEINSSDIYETIYHSELAIEDFKTEDNYCRFIEDCTETLELEYSFMDVELTSGKVVLDFMVVYEQGSNVFENDNAYDTLTIYFKIEDDVISFSTLPF